MEREKSIREDREACDCFSALWKFSLCLFAKTWKYDSIEVIDTVWRCESFAPMDIALSIYSRSRVTSFGGPRFALRSAEFKSLIHF